MSDPCRWMDEQADASLLERELIEAARAVGPSLEQKRRMCVGVAAVIAAPAVAAKVATASLSSASKIGLMKGAAVAVLVGGGVAGYHMTLRHSAPLVASAAPGTPSVSDLGRSSGAKSSPLDEGAGSVVPSAESADRPRIRDDLVLGSPSSKAARTNASSADDSSKNRGSRLAEEARVLVEARALLRSGQPARALALLDGANEAFADGVLAQEREAVTIEALAGSGRTAAASKRAKTFLLRYPRSPHASDVERFLVGP